MPTVQANGFKKGGNAAGNAIENALMFKSEKDLTQKVVNSGDKELFLNNAAS
jgi:hypothetical protein